MNAHQRRLRNRGVLRIVRSIVDVLRTLPDKIDEDPRGVKEDLRGVIDGWDREYGRERNSQGGERG